MYMVASADTLISSNAGGFQTHRSGRGATVFLAMAVTSFRAGFVGGVPGSVRRHRPGDGGTAASVR
jgi:hypothetical protein